MPRSLGITLTAVACGIAAVVGLLFTVLIFVSWLNPQARTPNLTSIAPVVMAVAMIVAFCGWSVATMIGLWKLRSWARWSVVAYCGFMVFIALTSGAVIAFVPLPATPNAPEGFAEGLRYGMVGFYAVVGVLAASCLIYFCRASVGAQFIAGNPSAAPSRRPLSVGVIGWMLLVSGFSVLIYTFVPMPAMLLGLVFTGFPARLVYLVWGVCYAGIGYGLLKLKPISRVAAIALFAFLILNSLVFLLLPGANDRVIEMIGQMPNMSNAPPNVTAMFSNGWLMRFSGAAGSLFSALPIWFLVKRRAAFGEA